MVSVLHSVDTAHEDIIHDSQMDYYGVQLATCSSDRTVKIFEIKNGAQRPVATLQGHEGPVWQISWAHPKYERVLASCSYDKKVIIWKEFNGTWARLYEYADHNSSVNSICWAPHEFGLMLACGSSDGAISILKHTGDNEWEATKIPNAHLVGCNAVSWAPAHTPGSVIDAPAATRPTTFPKMIVSAGSDKLVKIWREHDGRWVEDQKFENHSDWVRDCAWAPSVGLPSHKIASCSQDGRVIIWSNDGGATSQWTSTLLHKFDDVVWHVSWSLTGDILAVSGGNNKVSLWKEGVDGTWTRISDVTRGSATDATA